jgi:hypothetical protein
MVVAWDVDLTNLEGLADILKHSKRVALLKMPEQTKKFKISNKETTDSFQKIPEDHPLNNLYPLFQL